MEVIVGEEVSSKDGHVLGLFLEEWIPPGMDARSTVERIHDQGGLAVAAHPYTSWMRWAGLVGVGDLIRTLPFDAVETRNSNFTEYFANRKAERNAGGAARVGSSDSHFVGAIGRAYTEFPGRTALDLRQAILDRTTRPGGSCYGLGTLVAYVLARLRVGGSIFPRRQDFKRESASGGLEIKVHREVEAGTAVVLPVGRLDALSMPELKETLTLLADAKISVALDLSQVASVDSVGVTALVGGLQSAKRNGVSLCLVSLSSACSRTLSASGLLKKFPRAPDLSTAWQRMKGPPAAPEETVELSLKT
jgi:anti-anti-sigma factor